MSRTLWILGCGFTGTEVARHALREGWTVHGTTRDAERGKFLEKMGVRVFVSPVLDPDWLRAVVTNESAIVACFPPDGSTLNAKLAVSVRACAPQVYLSSTAVYGNTRGKITEETPIDRSDARGLRRYEAEDPWRENGAVVLRSAGIYGPNRGIHKRLREGTFRLTADGSNTVSRIHVEDLARIILKCVAVSLRNELFVVGDDAPVPQREAAAWWCERNGYPMPGSVSVEEAAETLRHDRAVDNARCKRVLGLSLKYPSFREGFVACEAAERKTA